MRCGGVAVTPSCTTGGGEPLEVASRIVGFHRPTAGTRQSWSAPRSLYTMLSWVSSKLYVHPGGPTPTGMQNSMRVHTTIVVPTLPETTNRWSVQYTHSPPLCSHSPFELTGERCVDPSRPHPEEGEGFTVLRKITRPSERLFCDGLRAHITQPQHSDDVKDKKVAYRRGQASAETTVNKATDVIRMLYRLLEQL